MVNTLYLYARLTQDVTATHLFSQGCDFRQSCPCPSPLLIVVGGWVFGRLGGLIEFGVCVVGCPGVWVFGFAWFLHGWVSGWFGVWVGLVLVWLGWLAAWMAGSRGA